MPNQSGDGIEREEINCSRYYMVLLVIQDTTVRLISIIHLRSALDTVLDRLPRLARRNVLPPARDIRLLLQPVVPNLRQHRAVRDVE